MSHRIAYYSFREINRRGKILAVTLELLCTNVPKPGNSRGDITVEFGFSRSRSSLTQIDRKASALGGGGEWGNGGGVKESLDGSKPAILDIYIFCWHTL